MIVKDTENVTDNQIYVAKLIKRKKSRNREKIFYNYLLKKIKKQIN